MIGEGTSIGPYCIIGPHAVIGANCKLVAHVNVDRAHDDRCRLRRSIHLLRSADLRRILSYRGEPTRLEIGEGCTIREGVTMNIGTEEGRRHHQGRRARILHEQQPCRP